MMRSVLRVIAGRTPIPSAAGLRLLATGGLHRGSEVGLTGGLAGEREKEWESGAKALCTPTSRSNRLPRPATPEDSLLGAVLATGNVSIAKAYIELIKEANEAEAHAKVAEAHAKVAEAHAKVAEAEVRGLEYRLKVANAEKLQMQGLLNMRGIIEHFQQVEMRRVDVAWDRRRPVECWAAYLDKEPALRECIKRHGLRVDTAATDITRMYGTLSATIHDSRSPREYQELGLKVSIGFPLDGEQRTIMSCLCQVAAVDFEFQGMHTS